MSNEASTVAIRSLNDDFACIINTYLPRYKSNPDKLSPENNIDCPFGELGLVDIANKKQKTYKKTIPSAKSFNSWVIYAVKKKIYMSMPKIECENIDKCCAAASLLQSIALEEAAISHILNAEGEKLQKGISFSCNLKDLIDINKSVEDVLDKLITLENVLKAKLDLIKPILDKCDKKPHKSECES